MSTISPELRPAVNHTDPHAQVWGITADAERTSDFGCV